MNNRLLGLVGAALLLSLQGIAAPVLAADVITVKVALADISSAMGMGPAGQGYGMMGPGMMGGMMAVRTDHSSVKTGTIHFDVTNWSQSRSKKKGFMLSCLVGSSVGA